MKKLIIASGILLSGCGFDWQYPVDPYTVCNAALQGVNTNYDNLHQECSVKVWVASKSAGFNAALPYTRIPR